MAGSEHLACLLCDTGSAAAMAVVELPGAAHCVRYVGFPWRADCVTTPRVVCGSCALDERLAAGGDQDLMAGSSKLLSAWLRAAAHTALEQYRWAAGRAVHHTSVRKDSASGA